jgi:hypothetical protein
VDGGGSGSYLIMDFDISCDVSTGSATKVLVLIFRLLYRIWQQ